MIPDEVIPPEVMELLRGPEPSLSVSPILFWLIPCFFGFLFAAHSSLGRKLAVRLSKKTFFRKIFPPSAAPQSPGRWIFSFLCGSMPFFLATDVCRTFARYAIYHYEYLLPVVLLVILLFSPLFFLSDVWRKAARIAENSAKD